MAISAVLGRMAVTRVGVSRKCAIITVENQAHHLVRIHSVESGPEQLAWCLTGRDNDEKTVNQRLQDLTISDRNHWGQVEHNVVVLPLCCFDQILAASGVQQFVRRMKGSSRRKDGEFERPIGLHDIFKRQLRVQNSLSYPIMEIERQVRAHRRMSKVKVDDQYAILRPLCQGASEIDRCEGLSVSGAGARDADNPKVGRTMGMLHDVTKLPVFLGFARARLQQAHQVLFDQSQHNELRTMMESAASVQGESVPALMACS